MLKKISKYILLFAKNIFYLICSCFYRKDPSIVLFDSWFGQKFSDNPRYLFQYLSENKNDLGLSHVVWVTRDEFINDKLNLMGYESYLINTNESIIFHKKAYYHICNNSPTTCQGFPGELLGQYSFRAIKINLWHGTGAIKKLNMATNDYKMKISRHPVLYQIKQFVYSNSSVYRKIFVSSGGWEDCYFLTTSKTELDKLQQCFPLPKEHFIISGYPRNTKQPRLLPFEEDIVKCLTRYKRIILYLPTFRSGQTDFNFTEISKKLAVLLEKKDILFIQKAHSADSHSDVPYKLEGNILNLNTNFDINILIPLVSVVMTDYSSVLADALYHYKPVILYVPDYEEYMTGDRGFSDDAEFLLSAGKKIYDITSLKCFLENYNFDDAKTDTYDEVRTRIWGEEKKNIEDIWQDMLIQTRR